MIMFKSPPQLLSQVHIDTKSSLELDHLRRLKQNLINEQNFIRQQFEEQLTLLKLRFKLELHSSQTDYELSQFHFKNKAEELFYRFRAIGATVPANLSTDSRHHAIVKNDHGNLSIETPTHLLIEILKIDRKLLDSLSAHLHTSYTCPKTPKDLRMKNEINRRVKTAIDSLNIKITNNEELINNLSKSLIDIATELCLINSEKHTELNEDTTNDPPITKHTISHCIENQSILDPLDDGDSPKNTKIPISTIISEGAVDNETELKTSRPRNVLEITAMLNADSGLESNQTQPIDSDEDNYSSDSSKGKSMIIEDFKNKIDPLTPPASLSVLTRSKASTSRRASLGVSSVTMKTSWSGNTDDTNSASLEIKTKNNETSSDENVESSIKYFNAKMKLQKDNELKEIQAIIPKNLKKKSRKDPNKYNSANILKKDPIDLRVCPICERKFYRAEHLKRHLTSVHNKEKPFSCAICQKNFTRKDNLNQHQKRKHGQEEDRR